MLRVEAEEDKGDMGRGGGRGDAPVVLSSHAPGRPALGSREAGHPRLDLRVGKVGGICRYLKNTISY